MKLITFIIVLLCISCSDVVTDHYLTHQDAKNDRLFIRGWLPDILPITSTNIKTENELDLNSSKGSFNIPVNDIPSFISILQKKSEQTYIYEHGKSKWVFTINHELGHVVYSLAKSHS